MSMILNIHFNRRVVVRIRKITVLEFEHNCINCRFTKKLKTKTLASTSTSSTSSHCLWRLIKDATSLKNYV